VEIIKLHSSGILVKRSFDVLPENKEKEINGTRFFKKKIDGM
jgi:hypothetical protein